MRLTNVQVEWLKSACVIYELGDFDHIAAMKGEIFRFVFADFSHIDHRNTLTAFDTDSVKIGSTFSTTVIALDSASGINGIGDRGFVRQIVSPRLIHHTSHINRNYLCINIR